MRSANSGWDLNSAAAMTLSTNGHTLARARRGVPWRSRFAPSLITESASQTVTGDARLFAARAPANALTNWRPLASQSKGLRPT